jgi:co-chaperonin GroES (HSP10)
MTMMGSVSEVEEVREAMEALVAEGEAKQAEDLPVTPVGWRLLIQPVDPITETEGGLALAEETIRAQEYLRNHGVVLAVGPLAYSDTAKFGNRAWCRTGDKVVFGRGAGVEVLLKNGKSLRLMNDDEILGRVEDESQLMRKM